MTPQCPPHYTCTFTPQTRYVVTQTVHTGPWYQHAGGLVVAILAVLAVALVLIWIIDALHKRADDRDAKAEREQDRQHKLALEEQRTMQAEQAHGDPEMLRLIRDR